MIILFAGCQKQSETMDSLDEDIAEVDVSESNSPYKMNESFFFTVTNDDNIRAIKQAITNAVKQDGPKAEDSDSDYDIWRVYELTGDESPTHMLRLWLGDEGKASRWSYFGHNDVYVIPPEMTRDLRRIIGKNE
ncbi:MAG TPA: hypothetical protein VK136_08650 [Bacillota bacterium]|nr:hypothetical protein [Bacillota bacterium]